MTQFRAGKSRLATDLAMVAIVFAAVLVCYWPALHGGVLWDDPAHLTRPDLRGWPGLRDIWMKPGATQEYYPALHGAFWLEHRLWGDAMVGYHLANVFLHAASCCLLALLLRELWTLRGADGTEERTRVAPAGAEWFAALLFAVHPVCVESVAWITEQKNTLSLLFYLLASLSYLRFVRGRGQVAYTAALGLFFLALAAKTATVTLPAALLVALWWREGRLDWRRDVLPLVPFFALAAGAGMVTVWVETNIVGADGTAFDWSLGERVMLAAHIIWFYLGKLVWPFGLLFYYEHWDVPAAAAGWWPYLLGVVVLTAALWAIRRRTRGPLAAWLLFVGSLFPVLGLFNVYGFTFSQVADHFQYLPCMVFLAAAAGAVAQLVATVPGRWRLAAGSLSLVIVAGLGFLSHRQSALYVDNETLFRSVLARNPQSWMAHHNLGLALARMPGGADAAIAEFRQTIALNPRFPNAHFALGRELLKQPGGQAEAIAEFERTLQLRSFDPDAHNALGAALARQPGRLPEAIAHFEAALKVRPLMEPAHLNLANALAREPGRLPEAMGHFELALHLDPGDARAHHDYACVLAKLPGHQAEAISQFETALRLESDYAEAHCDLANTLADLPGRTSEAIAHYEQALKLDPGSAPAHYGLANVLAMQAGRPDEALSHYEAALRLQPDFAEAHANLANVLARLPGRLTDAVAHYETALRINPKLAWVHFNLGLHLAQIPGRATDAMAHYEAALRIQPDYTDALNGLAILYAQAGRFDEARVQWQRALAIDPSYELARRNLELLDRMAAQRP
ncbi:MAG TPA: tetratricopeptide repeat protein [Opitutus sp.]|nr:tetratricopeptide repeat protein [Opitutus sp.]